VQPNSFPLPWGKHPNFMCHCKPQTIDVINGLDNVYKWSFGIVRDDFYDKWSNVYEIPLAYDSNGYRAIEDKSYQYDVCFVGGWANNGFNEKKRIMLDHFRELMHSGIKCGLYIGKNLSHEQENKILYNSKIALNIHDKYQRVLGLDTNERTFKSLGLTGILISDKIDHVNKYFPDVPLFENPKAMVKEIRGYLNLPESELQKIKMKNREMIKKEHTYVSRVKNMLELS
jgi:spore maturation protein CgeB